MLPMNFHKARLADPTYRFKQSQLEIDLSLEVDTSLADPVTLAYARSMASRRNPSRSMLSRSCRKVLAGQSFGAAHHGTSRCNRPG
jgi:hypothetical protein